MKNNPPMTEDDYWRIILNNYTKDGLLPYGDKNRLKVLNKFIISYGNKREAQGAERGAKELYEKVSELYPTATMVIFGPTYEEYLSQRESHE